MTIIRYPGRGRRARTSLFLALTTVLLAVLASIQPAAAAPPVRLFTLGLTTSPATVKAAHVVTFTATLTNSASSTSSLDASDLTINSAFSSPVLTSGTLTTSGGGTWTATLVSGVIQLRADSGSDRLGAGQSVAVTFTATAPCVASSPAIFSSTLAGTRPGTWNFSLSGGVPTVPVTLTPTNLAITSIADASGDLVLVSGEPFDTTVQADAPVDCDTVVTLSENSAGGSFGGTPAGTIPAGQTDVTIAATYSPADNGVQVCASATGLAGGCAVANIALDAMTDSSEGALVLCAGGTSTCSAATAARNARMSPPSEDICDTNATNPTCVFVTLPDGTNGEAATVAVFDCDGQGGLPSDCGGEDFVLFIGEAGVFAPYSTDNFYLMTVECDRTLCGNGGKSSYVSFIAQAPGGVLGPFNESLACTPSVNDAIAPAAAAALGFCTDYNASNRDNHQDLRLVHRLSVDPGRK